jgi:hypothetical protein
MRRAVARGLPGRELGATNFARHSRGAPRIKPPRLRLHVFACNNTPKGAAAKTRIGRDTPYIEYPALCMGQRNAAPLMVWVKRQQQTI